MKRHSLWVGRRNSTGVLIGSYDDRTLVKQMTRQHTVGYVKAGKVGKQLQSCALESMENGKLPSGDVTSALNSIPCED